MSLCCNKSIQGGRERALEEDEGLAKGRTPEEMIEGETRAAIMVGGARSRSSQVGTLSTTRMMTHDGVKGGRSHGGYLAEDTRGTTDGDAGVTEDQCGAGGKAELKGWRIEA